MTERDDPAVEDYLHYLSQRIRGFRAARGMMRKHLAQHSGISERYLAQLETGAANPSVDVLWRVAEAMDVDFPDLLSVSRKSSLANASLWRLLQRLSPAEQESAYELLIRDFGGAEAAAKPGIALIGLRGGGKTTLGRGVAEKLGWPFVRLGEYIERIAGMQLAEIFPLVGQKTYRRLEREALEKVIAETPRAIVEAGGSIVSEPGTFDLLLGSFTTVWVQARPEEHMQRVLRQGDTRPMQGNHAAMADLTRILSEREAEYARADYTLDTRGRGVDACLDELARLVLATRDEPAVAV